MKGKKINGFVVIIVMVMGLFSLILGPMFSPAPLCVQNAHVTTIGPAPSLGTDVAGTSFNLSGGRATGNAAGGNILFKTSDVGSSGVTLQALSTKAILTVAGRMGINITAPTAYLDANTPVFRLRLPKTPATASDAGHAGDICWDPNYVYVCTYVDPNGVAAWKRTGMLHSW